MNTKLTEAQFSMQCSFIAKNASAWAGDLLTLPEHYHKEADHRTVARFTDEMRERIDRLDKWAGRPEDHFASECDRLRGVLHRIIELDHHNMGPESNATKIAREALNGGAS